MINYNLKELNDLSNKNIKYKPIGIYYSKNTNKIITVTSIVLENKDTVPVINKNMNFETIKNKGLFMENKPLDDTIDEYLSNKDMKILHDDRLLKTKYFIYYNETYQLFRLELSNYLNNNENIKNEIIKIKNNKNINNKNKIKEIKSILFTIADKNFFRKYIKSLKSSNNIKKYKQFLTLINKTQNIKDYKLNNERLLCKINRNKDICNRQTNCNWFKDKCFFNVSKDIAIDYIIKISEEFINNNISMMEVLNIDDYSVFDIVDTNQFKKTNEEKIINSDNFNINRILKKIFGKSTIPNIGKRKGIKYKINYNEINKDNPIKIKGNIYIQNIISEDNTIFRAYSNGIFYIKSDINDININNLGYFSEAQTSLSDYFKSYVIEWLMNNHNMLLIKKDLSNKSKLINDIKYYISDYLEEREIMSPCIIELYVLSKLYTDIPIIVYNDERTIIYIFSNGIIYNYKNKSKMTTINKKKSINIGLNFGNNDDIPESIDIIFFK